MLPIMEDQWLEIINSMDQALPPLSITDHHSSLHPNNNHHQCRKYVM
jgi:hypothetical protein